MQLSSRIVLLCMVVLVSLESRCQTALPSMPSKSSDADSAKSSAGPLDRKEMMRQARRSYYNLPSAGLKEFRCQVLPGWNSMYSQLKVDDVGRNKLLPILNQARFQVVVGPNGASSVSRESEIAPEDEQLAERVRRSLAGAEQMLTGFFHTWTGFAIKSPLPGLDSDYELHSTADKYRLKFKDGSADVAESMDHEFAIEELTASTTEFSGTVHPHLSKGKNGFTLTGYDATYNSGDTTGKVSVNIGYQDVEGFQLPGTVIVSVPFGDRTLNIPLTFTDCQVKRQ